MTVSPVSEQDLRDAKSKIARFVYSNLNISAKAILLLALGGMIVDAWDAAAFGFGTTFFVRTFHPTATYLGLSIVAVNIGAVIGSVTGGFLVDRIGRKLMFIVNMILFVVMAFLAASSQNLVEFFVFRALLGFPVGADEPDGVNYLFEFSEQKQRLKWTSSVALAFGVMYPIAALGTLGLFEIFGANPLVWRLNIAIGGIAALIILIFRTRMPESALWLANRGKFKDSKAVLKKVYGKAPEDVPDVNYELRKTRVRDVFSVFRKGYNKVLLHSWTNDVVVGYTSWSFGIFLPLALAEAHASGGIRDSLYFDAFIYTGALIGAIVAMKGILVGFRKWTAIMNLLLAVSLAFVFLSGSNIIPFIYIVPSAWFVLFFTFTGPFTYWGIVNTQIPTTMRGIVNGWTLGLNKGFAVIASLLAASIVLTVGITGTVWIPMGLALGTMVVSIVYGRDGEKLNAAEVDIRGLNVFEGSNSLQSAKKEK
jgi:MFS family permease